MSGGDWDDDRMTKAYHAAFHHPAPPDLATAALARIAPGPSPRRARWTRPISRIAGLVGIAAVVAVAIALAAGPLGLGPIGADRPTEPPMTGVPGSPGPTVAVTSTPAPEGRFPTTMLGLPVVSVSEAIAHRDTSLGDTELAVRGYYVDPGPVPCPAPSPEYVGTAIFGRCPVTWLIETLETEIRPPTEPGLSVVFDLASAGDRPTGPASDIVPVVLLGHFADHRAHLCPAAGVGECRRQFVVDRVAWVDGATPTHRAWFALEVSGGAPGATRPLVPLLDEPTISSWVSSVAFGGDILSVGAIAFSRVTEVEPAVDPPWIRRAYVADHPVWIVRVLVGHSEIPRVRTLIIDEGSSMITEILADGSLAEAGQAGSAVWLPTWATPDIVPDEVAVRVAVPFCGVEGSPDQPLFSTPPNESARACLMAAWEAGTPAEFARIQVTIEGDPIATIIRLEPGRRIVVYRDATQDAFGSRVWSRQTCSELLPAQPVGFVVDGCDDGVVLY